jgi:hypothetical protein
MAEVNVHFHRNVAPEREAAMSLPGRKNHYGNITVAELRESTTPP